MSHTPSSSTPDVDNDIHAMIRLMQEQMQQQQHLLQQQQARIQQLEASNREQYGKVVYKNPRATTLKLYPELIDAYPAIGESKFFDSELPKNHDVFNWHDFHYTEGMKYKPPPVLQHSEVSLEGPAKKHEKDLATIQGYLAHRTRSYDTLALEIVSTGTVSREQVLSFLNTVRISASHDASRISRMREKLYLDS
ncbi:hypothetical protein EC991_002965 [Linnemannia zychae]|nr:hypothetical protein EC991_002965 [Linnemannia zychae]